MSGDSVPTMMQSTSAAATPASASAAWAASTARSLVEVPGSTNRRSRMPVRCWIQASSVFMVGAS
jgi:hypothetical protein